MGRVLFTRCMLHMEIDEDDADEDISESDIVVDDDKNDDDVSDDSVATTAMSATVMTEMAVMTAMASMTAMTAIESDDSVLQRRLFQQQILLYDKRLIKHQQYASTRYDCNNQNEQNIIYGT